MYVCEIIEESLEDKDILGKLSGYLVKDRIADVPNEPERIWHIKRYRFPLNILNELVPLLEAKLKREWYIHAFNTDEDILYVIFRGKYFILPAKKGENWTEMIDYGLTVGVERKWTENIPVD